MDNVLIQSLHCDAADCLHNYNQRCGASIIQVNGGAATRGKDTYCNSYVCARDTRTNEILKHPSGEIGLEGKVDTEFGNDLNAQTFSPKITCTAGKCQYNSKYYCHAKEVDIESPKEDGSMRCECNTFRPK